MALERTYTIPLRKAILAVPRYKRAKKAVAAVKVFMKKHMKTENVLVGPKLNLKIWEKGIKNPPHHVKVTAVKDEKEDIARVELLGFKFEKKEKKEKKAQKPSGLAGKIQQKLEAKEDKKPKEKPTTKKDIKEVKKGVEKKSEQSSDESQQKEEKADTKPENKDSAEEKAEVESTDSKDKAK